MRYYIYILYSLKFDKFYIGYTSDYENRFESQNTNSQNTFTSKYRPWIMKAIYLVGENKTEAIKIERFIKKQKSRMLLLKMIKDDFVPKGFLSQLVRVPHVRD